MSTPGMCSVCGGLVWRGSDHACPPPVLATSPVCSSQAGLQSWLTDRARIDPITVSPVTMRRAAGAVELGS